MLQSCCRLCHDFAKELTDFQLVVQAPLPSSTRPSVVNLVQLDITLARLWLDGAGHRGIEILCD